VQRADIRVIQRRHRPGFALKASAELGLGRFDGDFPAQAGIQRLVHLTHPARAERRDDFIRAQFVACGKRHMRSTAKFSRSRSELA